MDSSHLTEQQAERMRAIVGRQLTYLNKLTQRMTRLGFPTDDPLWLHAMKARDAMQDLHVACTRAGPVTGVGRPQR